jgi:hypothetical protein
MPKDGYGYLLHECVRPGCTNRKADGRLVCKECRRADSASASELPPVEPEPAEPGGCFQCGGEARSHLIPRGGGSPVPVCEDHAHEMRRNYGSLIRPGPVPAVVGVSPEDYTWTPRWTPSGVHPTPEQCADAKERIRLWQEHGVKWRKRWEGES